MNIIRLTSGQKRQMKINHPMLDGCEAMTEAQANKATRDELIMGHMFFVKVIVGRFLANWPETRRFEEDMVSEGILAAIEAVDSDFQGKFQPMCWNKIKVAIEVMLNRDRSLFSPATTKQWEVVASGREPIYNYAKQLNESIEGGEEDYSLEFVDIADDLQHLSETDREDMMAIIIRYMENDHDILESELSQKERDSLDHITKAITSL